MSVKGIRSIPGIDSADLVRGDLTNFGNRTDAKKIHNESLSINLNIFALIGNLDRYDINAYLNDLIDIRINKTDIKATLQ